MIVGGNHSWNPDCKFSHKPLVSIMKGDFQLIKIKLIQTSSNQGLKKKMLSTAPIFLTLITSSTSSTSPGLQMKKHSTRIFRQHLSTPDHLPPTSTENSKLLIFP